MDCRFVVADSSSNVDDLKTKMHADFCSKFYGLYKSLTQLSVFEYTKRLHRPSKTA